MERFGNRYPWKDWLGAVGVRLLAKGKDYRCTSTGMAQNVYAAAKRLGAVVRVEVQPKGISLEVVKPPSARRAPKRPAGTVTRKIPRAKWKPMRKEVKYAS